MNPEGGAQTAPLAPRLLLYDVNSVPDMTYNVFIGTLNPTQSTNL